MLCVHYLIKKEKCLATFFELDGHRLTYFHRFLNGLVVQLCLMSGEFDVVINVLKLERCKNIIHGIDLMCVNDMYCL